MGTGSAKGLREAVSGAARGLVCRNRRPSLTIFPPFVRRLKLSASIASWDFKANRLESLAGIEKDLLFSKLTLFLEPHFFRL